MLDGLFRRANLTAGNGTGAVAALSVEDEAGAGAGAAEPQRTTTPASPLAMTPSNTRGTIRWRARCYCDERYAPVCDPATRKMYPSACSAKCQVGGRAAAGARLAALHGMRVLVGCRWTRSPRRGACMPCTHTTHPPPPAPTVGFTHARTHTDAHPRKKTTNTDGRPARGLRGAEAAGQPGAHARQRGLHTARRVSHARQQAARARRRGATCGGLGRAHARGAARRCGGRGGGAACVCACRGWGGGRGGRGGQVAPGTRARRLAEPSERRRALALLACRRRTDLVLLLHRRRR
jgi:hypothetical protein